MRIVITVIAIIGLVVYLSTLKIQRSVSMFLRIIFLLAASYFFISCGPEINNLRNQEENKATDLQLDNGVANISNNPSQTPILPPNLGENPGQVPCSGLTPSQCAPSINPTQIPAQPVDPCLPFYGVPGHVCNEPVVPCLGRFYNPSYICDPAFGDIPVNQLPPNQVPASDNIPVVTNPNPGVTDGIPSPDLLGPDETIPDPNLNPLPPVVLDPTAPPEPISPVDDSIPVLDPRIPSELNPISDPTNPNVPAPVLPTTPLGTPELPPTVAPAPVPGIEPF